jgi:8-oxo-dGTP pyrophosphatase MutT (NUDIX family)
MTDAEAALRAALSRPAGPSSDFDLNPGIRPPADKPLRPAAVLVPVWLRPEGARLILTKRSSHLKHHPGQIAFPGGKVDASDASAEAAALRETLEEIGLPPQRVEIIGTLPVHETVTGFAVTPFVGLIRGPFEPTPEVGEVEEVFTVPLTHVLSPARFAIERRRWMGVWRRYYTVPYGPYYIWGATARILRGLADRVGQ